MTFVHRSVFQWLCHRQCREATREAITADREFNYLPKYWGQAKCVVIYPNFARGRRNGQVT